MNFSCVNFRKLEIYNLILKINYLFKSEVKPPVKTPKKVTQKETSSDDSSSEEEKKVLVKAVASAKSLTVSKVAAKKEISSSESDSSLDDEIAAKNESKRKLETVIEVDETKTKKPAVNGVAKTNGKRKLSDGSDSESDSDNIAKPAISNVKVICLICYLLLK